MKRNALTQSQFAEKAHIGDKTLYRLLSSNKTIPPTWAEVAKAMGVPPDKLIKS
jgi:predicted transcriptional regulator